MCKLGRKMGLKANWEGPYYIFLRYKYNFSEQEFDEKTFICILQVMKNRTWERFHRQLINILNFGTSCNFVGHIFY
jgi:hypothetical protein